MQDDRGIAKALATKLNRLGKQTVLVVDELPCDARHVIFLAGLNQVTDEAQAISLNYQFFKIAKQLAVNLKEAVGFLVALQDTNGCFGLENSLEERAWLAGIRGLSKTAKLEWPQASVKTIDLYSRNIKNNLLAERILTELLQGGDDDEIALNQAGKRFIVTTELAAKPNSDQTLRLQIDNTIIVTGGASGVTAECLKALAEHTKLNIAIFSRTPLSQLEELPDTKSVESENQIKQILFKYYHEKGVKLAPKELQEAAQKIIKNRQIHATLSSLMALGSKVNYYAVDIADPEKLSAAVSQVKKDFGPIHGLIHGAGVLADKEIAHKTVEQFTKVFSTKVDGFSNLLVALKGEPLSHIMCFSSIAARIGNRGQVDYAMANEILNKVCQEQRRLRGNNCLVKSINWGPLDGGMVTAELKAHFESNNIGLVPLEEVTQAFMREIQSNDTVEVVLAVDIENWITRGKEETDKKNGATSIWVQEQSYPFIKGHFIEGVAVLPLVLVIEWCARIVKRLCPEKHISSIKNLTVHKAMLLNNYFEQGDWISIQHKFEPVHNDVILAMSVTLSKTKTKHFSLQIQLSDHPLATPTKRIPEQWLKLPPTEFTPVQGYEKILFHREAFQVIKSIDGYLDKQLVGTLYNPDWYQRDSWITDVGILDGGLQFALIGIYLKCGKKALPVKLDEIYLYRTHFYGQPIRCELTQTHGDNLHMKGDMVFMDAEGNLLAEIKGADAHIIENYHRLKSNPNSNVIKELS